MPITHTRVYLFDLLCCVLSKSALTNSSCLDASPHCQYFTNQNALYVDNSVLQAFKLQPDLIEQLQALSRSFVEDTVNFGVSLSSRRRGATLRPTDLALYLERTHHLHVPGFTKEYHPYRRPAASELHKERSTLVRKALLQGTAGGGDGGAAGARGAGAAAE